MLLIQEHFTPVFIGIQADLYIKIVTTQLPYSFPFRGKVGMGGTHDAGTVSALAPTLTLPRKGREQDKTT